ncbi:hypothetical protein ACLB2K_008978 [Fragaria x ananassa]
MITRQLNFKTLQRIRKPRLTTSTICSKFHSYNHEHHLSDEIPKPDAAAVNRSMLNYMHRNLSATALDIFTKQFQHCSYPRNIDEVTVTLAVKACQGDPKPGCQIHGFAVSSGFISHVTVSNAHDISLNYGHRCHSFLIKLGSVTDPITAGALLDMYAKRGSICESQRVFCETPHRTQFSWTAIISAYAGHGDYDSVVELFYQMDKEGMKPDSITFLSVLSACSRKGSVEMGRHFFESIVPRLSDRTISSTLCLYGGHVRPGRKAGGSRGVDESDVWTAEFFFVAKLARGLHNTRECGDG